MDSVVGSHQQPASSTNLSSSGGGAAFPVYEPPTAPLNAENIRKLNNLLQQYPSNEIVEGLKNAASLLTASAADINERVYDKTKRNRVRQEHRRNKRAKRRKGDQNDAEEEPEEEASDNDEEARRLDDQENEELEQLKTKVDAITPRMDAGLRKMIDQLAGVDFLKKGLQEIQSAAQDAASQPAVPLSTQLSSVTRNTVHEGDEDEGEREAEGSSEANADTQITQPASVNLSSTPAIPKLPQIFQNKLGASKDKYAALPARTRYGASNLYTGFKRAVWDSQYPPDQAPPMPKPSTWFREEEQASGPAPGVTRSRPSNAAAEDADEAEDDDDLEVALIHTSTTCPLTLQEFKDPVTSSKCPHSFERSAIETLLAGVRPPEVPGRRGRNAAPPPGWKPSVRCPVGGCENMLTRNDLVHDAALVRRIQRIQRVRQVDRDDDDDDDGDDEAVDDDDGNDDDGHDGSSGGGGGGNNSTASKKNQAQGGRRQPGARRSSSRSGRGGGNSSSRGMMQADEIESSGSDS